MIVNSHDTQHCRRLHCFLLHQQQMRIGCWCSIKITTVEDSVNAQDSKPLQVSTKASKVCQLPVICQKHIASWTVRKPNKRISFPCFLSSNSSNSSFPFVCFWICWLDSGEEVMKGTLLSSSLPFPQIWSNIIQKVFFSIFDHLLYHFLSTLLSAKERLLCFFEFPWGTR